METIELKVGELAKRTGLSVRTLHHYDEIGLLAPARRTPSGHRIYGADEISRLQRIASLRQIGFSLEEIRACLDRPAYSLARVVELHIGRLEERIETQRRLRGRLEGIRGRLLSAETVSPEQLLQTIEVTTMLDDYYTKDELEYLEARRERVGDERIQRVQKEWAELFAAFETAMGEGADPAGDPVLKLARKARGLIEEFTGGHAGVERSLGRAVSENRQSMYETWGVAPEVAAYMGQAMAALAAAD